MVKTYKILIAAILAFVACSDSKSIEETGMQDMEMGMEHLAESDSRWGDAIC